MQKRHQDSQIYFKELAQSCADYYIPYLKEKLSPDFFQSPKRILEIGCGQGGHLLPFTQMGWSAHGIDLNKNKIETGIKFFKEKNLPVFLNYGDFLNFIPPPEIKYFDLIFIHDVIEHVPQKDAFLQLAMQFLAPQGYMFIGFPAWQMPFGGHQQICPNPLLSKIPFIHLLPAPFYKKFLQLFGTDESSISELLDIKKCRTSIELFRKIIKQNSFTLIDERLYFINPHYDAKFGMRPVRLPSLISRIPYVRNYFSTSCFYLLQK